VVRLLLLLLSMLTVNRARQREVAWDQNGDRHDEMSASGRGGVVDREPWPGPDDVPGQPGWPPQPPRDAGDFAPRRPGGGAGRGRPRRRRIPRWLKWGAVAVAAGLIFRRAIAYAVLVALSAALHLVGVNVHLPHLRFAWPWQSITSGTVTNTDLGPWVLQRIEGISRPALGRASFTFVFTHKVSKNIGPWPSIPARPGGHRRRVTTGCRSSATRLTANPGTWP
jgi:hypothetical protein